MHSYYNFYNSNYNHVVWCESISQWLVSYDEWQMALIT
jgi:hypothetical protein